MPADRRLLAGAVVAVLLLLAAALPWLGEPYYTKLAARVAIFALVAVSLDLLVGYAGLVSLGQAAFFGLGAYVAGVLSLAGLQQALIVLPLAALGGAVLGAGIGAVSLRASGLYYIFITLAFAQMVFYIAAGLRPLGGLDGFRLPAPTTLPGGLTLGDPAVLLYVSLGLLVLGWWLSARLVRSPFGLVVQAARDNPQKLAAVGLAAYPARLALCTVSAAMAATAGALYANLTQFVAPASMSIFLSAEFLFMVIIGGAGTLLGPVLGAIALIALEQVLSGLTQHWLFWLGIVLVLRVLFLRKGLVGLLAR